MLSVWRKNSAAGKAGIQKGDIIVSFDGQTVSGKDDLESKLAYYASGETVDVVVSRADNGEYVQKDNFSHARKQKLIYKNLVYSFTGYVIMNA